MTYLLIVITGALAAAVAATLRARWSRWWGREAAFWTRTQALIAHDRTLAVAYADVATWCRDNPQPWRRCLGDWVNPNLRYRAHLRTTRCSCGDPGAYALTPGETITHTPTVCTIGPVIA